MHQTHFLSKHSFLYYNFSLWSCHYFFSVNFKKNEKVYNPEKSEVLKMLQENESDPEPGNTDTTLNNVDDSVNAIDNNVITDDEVVVAVMPLANNVATVANDVVVVVNNDDHQEQERLSHYYTLACMLQLLNSGDSTSGNIFSNDKLID